MNRILLVNQSSFVKTGYGIIGNELLTRLSKDYPTAELACDCSPYNNDLNSRAWKIYPNLPLEHEQQQYHSNPINAYGRWKFEQVCLDFKPTHVISFRDNWMDCFIGRSPYKKCYNWIYMPTIDAPSQNKEWLFDYSVADKLFCYQQWSANTLYTESGGRLIAEPNYIGCNNHPLSNRDQIKKDLGLNGFVIGTVMRNMARKRFPELFRAFGKIVQNHPNVILYCHTSYPDKEPWNIPRLLLENNIQNNVVFTHTCQNCHDVWPSKYKGKLSFCPKCLNKSAVMATPGKGLSEEQMNIMYNIFDLYVQFSNLEGFGMPLIEASMAGTPTLAPKFSAMIDVIDKNGGEYINIDASYKDTNSDRWCGIPSESDLIKKVNRYIKMDNSKLNTLRNQTYTQTKSNFSWDKFYSKIKNSIDSLPNKSWKTQVDIQQPSEPINGLDKLTNSEFVRWCIVNVLKDHSKINTYFEGKIIDELESSIRHTGRDFINIDRQMIYNEMLNARNSINYMEDMRCKKFYI